MTKCLVGFIRRHISSALGRSLPQLLPNRNFHSFFIDRDFLKVYNWIPESFYKTKIIHFVNIKTY